MKSTKHITIKAADANKPKKDPVLPVNIDLIDSRSADPKKVLPTNILF